jgi:phosphate-selective porin OprO and OprP
MKICLAVVLILSAIAAPAVGEEAVTREEFDQLKSELAELKSRAVPLELDQAGEGGAPAGEPVFGEYWDDGLHAVSRDGTFDVRIGGRIHIDGAFFRTDEKIRSAAAAIPGNDPFESGWEVRHPRIYLKGRIYNDFIYKLQYTFSDGTVGDAFLGAAGVPVLGTVIFGKAARAFGNDPGPNSNYTLFMEYANTIIFGAGGQVGVAAGSPVIGNRISWAAQVFQFVDGKGLRTEDNYNLNARLTGLPWYRDGGREMLHLGTSYSYRSSKDDYRLWAQPENHLAPYLVDTGDIAIERANLFVLEGAWVTGPFSLESEWYSSLVEREDGLSSLFFSGFYVQSSLFLTGESRGTQYVTSYGEFDSPVEPDRDFSLRGGGWGAWQLTARYSWIDLNDREIRGGVLGDLTLGLNWQLNPNLRWMLNYIHSHRNGYGDADIIATRFAVNI